LIVQPYVLPYIFTVFNS